MASSFEKINYSLRPNKSIERKMICEVLSNLIFFDHLENYRYIGLGSPFFSDFVLFHQRLGIKKLISIEKEKAKLERFKFNKPYSNIDLIPGQTSSELPNLKLDSERNIVWLDFDDKISDYMFSDINTFFTKSRPGSFFIISMNVEEAFPSWDSAKDKENDLKTFRFNSLRNSVGERVPVLYENSMMNTKKLCEVSYHMIIREIQNSLDVRNGEGEDKVKFKQLIHFFYKDGAAILTVGGLLYCTSEEEIVNRMNFDDIPFVRQGDQYYHINSPSLTFKEVKALDRILPNSLATNKYGILTDKVFRDIPLKHSDIINYAKIYRYYPNYTETNI